nr:phage replicative helicase, DnaB family (TIGR03600) [uncultured Mediterranean phage uvMED]
MIIPTNVDFGKYLADISFLEQQNLHWSDHWADQVEDRVVNGRKLTGERFPWEKTQNNFRLRQGELTIWAGINGHRKSMILGQIMTYLARNTKVCIASLEMRPEETLHRMASQAAGCRPSAAFARKFAEWGNERILIYDQLDTVEAEKILGMAHYAAKELGCKHIVIDSLTKCGLPHEDYTAEKKFVDRLQWAAKHYRIHIHLVSHVRKGIGESRVPDKFDVKGSGNITDIADNVVICWKDKGKEEAKRKQKERQSLTFEQVELLEKPDQLLCVSKQRNGEFEGNIALWFRDDSLQFEESEGRGVPPLDI